MRDCVMFTIIPFRGAHALRAGSAILATGDADELRALAASLRQHPRRTFTATVVRLRPARRSSTGNPANAAARSLSNA